MIVITRRIALIDTTC